MSDYHFNIFGSSSSLGQSLQTVLSERGQSYSTFTRAHFSVTDSADDLARLIRPGSIVVNCVALTDVDACEKKAEDSRLINGLFVGSLAKACALADANLIQISTDYVFPSGNLEWSEDDQPNPLNAYGKSKLEGEKLALESDGLVVRTSVLFSETNGFPSRLLALAREKGKLKLPDNLFGTPTSVKVLAQWISNLSQPTSEARVLHACCSGAISRYEFGLKIIAQLGITVDLGANSFSLGGQHAPRPTYSAIAPSMAFESLDSSQMLAAYSFI